MLVQEEQGSRVLIGLHQLWLNWCLSVAQQFTYLVPFLPQIFLLDIALLDTTDIILHSIIFSKSFNFLRSYINVFYPCRGCPVFLSISLKSEIFMNKQPYLLS